MAAPKLEKTLVAGVYKRGGRYVVTFRDGHGKQRKQFAKTLAEARHLKASLRTDIARGEYRERSRVTFEQYAREWIESYAGRTSRGVRDETRADYRKHLEQDAIPVLGRKRLSEIEPRDLDLLSAHIAKRGVKPATVRVALAPVKALLATAHQRGDIRSNPAAGYRTRFEQPDVSETNADEAKALTESDLTALLASLPDEWRLFFRFLAETGLRIGEAIELRWGDVDLGATAVRVSRRFYGGSVAAPKSKYGRRTVRLSTPLARELWTVRQQAHDDELVFTAAAGGRIDQSNLMSRILKPAAVAAGLGSMVGKPPRPESWVGFHTFRHTCATMLFRRGWNAVQVQRFLGHHKPSFTLDTYVHLLDEDLPQPSFELGELPQRGKAEGQADLVDHRVA